MNKFYTNFMLDKGKVHVRGWENGHRFKEVVKYSPTLYLPSKEPTKFKSLDGDYVAPLNFSTISEAYNYMRQYEDVHGFQIYGSTQWAYSYIYENFKNQEYDVSQISVVNLDIEVGADEFPNADVAKWPITAITMTRNKQIISLGCQPYTPKLPNVTYVLCTDEEELLEKFLYYWENMDPDVVTGWNTDGFDIPYIINRITRVMGKSSAERLSPWRKLTTRTVMAKFGKEQIVHEICGVTSLDYLQLYKKFSFKNEESYSLDNIAFVVIGEKKMDYSEVASLNELYKTNFEKYMDYNIRDVLLVEKIDEKLGFINQVFAIAYDSYVNFADTFTSVKIWEIIMYNYLLDQGILPPKKSRNAKERQIVGGYVKEPEPGKYRWVCSFDLNSLYPHLIMQYNISPETLYGIMEDLNNPELCVDMILDGFINKERRATLDQHNMTLTAGGACYSKEKKGFVPILMEKMYNDRTVFKGKMLDEKKNLVAIEEEMKKRGMKIE